MDKQTSVQSSIVPILCGCGHVVDNVTLARNWFEEKSKEKGEIGALMYAIMHQDEQLDISCCPECRVLRNTI